MNSELRSNLLNLNLANPSILDLGSCSPTQFFCLFKEFKSRMNKTFVYTAVDLCDAYNIFHHNCPHIIKEVEYEIETNDWVKSFNGQCCQNIEETTEYLIDEKTFNDHFKFFFETDILDYLLNKSVNQEFDAILLSNILHKLNYSNAEIAFNKCLSYMNKNSLIYVSVLGDKYEHSLPEDNLYDQKRYLRLKDKIDTIWCNEDDTTHFQFIGRIKNSSATK